MSVLPISLALLPVGGMSQYEECGLLFHPYLEASVVGFPVTGWYIEFQLSGSIKAILMTLCDDSPIHSSLLCSPSLAYRVTATINSRDKCCKLILPDSIFACVAIYPDDTELPVPRVLRYHAYRLCRCLVKHL